MQAAVQEGEGDMIDLFEREDRVAEVGNRQLEPCILVGVEDLSYHRLKGEEKVSRDTCPRPHHSPPHPPPPHRYTTPYHPTFTVLA